MRGLRRNHQATVARLAAVIDSELRYQIATLAGSKERFGETMVECASLADISLRRSASAGLRKLARRFASKLARVVLAPQINFNHHLLELVTNLCSRLDAMRPDPSAAPTLTIDGRRLIVSPALDEPVGEKRTTEHAAALANLPLPESSIAEIIVLDPLAQFPREDPIERYLPHWAPRLRIGGRLRLKQRATSLRDDASFQSFVRDSLDSLARVGLARQGYRRRAPLGADEECWEVEAYRPSPLARLSRETKAATAASRLVMSGG